MSLAGEIRQFNNQIVMVSPQARLRVVLNIEFLLIAICLGFVF